MLYAHYVLVCDFVTHCRFKLYVLCHLKVYKKMLDYYFCKFISCMRYHSICYDASILCYRYITRSCTHINKCNVQHTIVFWYCNIYCGYWLKRHVRNCKSGLTDSRVKSIYNILRKECYDHILSYFICFMTFYAYKQFIVYKIFYSRISYTIKLVFCIIILL